MKPFDCIVTIGDSCSWGSDLPENQRIEQRFDTRLAQEFNVESINLAKQAATNFCYKWHWIDWLQAQPTYKNPLVIVGITYPNRHLIWNNSADFFQESPGNLVSEDMVQANWGNNAQGGGFIRAYPNFMDFPDAIKKQCRANFYRYTYDDVMAEIYTLWEIKLLHSMINEHGGQSLFWSNHHSYQQTQLPWARLLLKDCALVHDLQCFLTQPIHWYGKDGHPNELGHQYLATVLEQFIRG